MACFLCFPILDMVLGAWLHDHENMQTNYCKGNHLDLIDSEVVSRSVDS